MTARAVLRSANGKLRAPWRLLIFAVVGVLFALVAQIIIGLIGPTGGEAEIVSVGTIAFYWSLVLAFLAAHAVMLRFVDHQPWSFVWMDRTAAKPGLL
ncbi:MAG: hypothetical protein M3125_06340, partial [Gemmatimonadota bacterium]|nr:hypothetical protein [Gemmatimonadota bacterium]